MRFRCTTHKVEVEVKDNFRHYFNLSWAGSPQCELFTIKELKEGVISKCKIVRID